MSYVWAVLFAVLILPLPALNILGLPGNWLILGGGALYAWLTGTTDMGLSFFLWIAALAALGEGVELYAQMSGAKRSGGTGRGNWGSLLGALAGAVLGAPFLFGLGSLAGALAGAFAGSYLLERLGGLPSAEAVRAAKGAMLGRAMGLTAKTGLGAAMAVLAVKAGWPG